MVNLKLIEYIEKNLKLSNVSKVITLYEEGNTIPFMARYRKEVTGNKDEVEIKLIIDTYEKFVELEKRKEFIKSTLKEKGVLTTELIKEIDSAKVLKDLEELYKPFKEKKSRKIEKVETLGAYDLIKSESKKGKLDINKIESFIKEKDSSIDIEEVKDLIKEVVKEEIVLNPKVRKGVKKLYESKSFIRTKLKDGSKDVNKKYERYYDYKEEVSKIKGNRLLAIEKAEREGVLKVSYEIEKDNIIKEIESEVFKKEVKDNLLKEAVKESYSKRLKSSVEKEVYGDLLNASESEAISIFETNLENLLLKSPLKNTKILALDPAYRTGCKLAVLTSEGKLEKIEVIYPHAPKNLWIKSKERLKELVVFYNIELIVIGNGTASKESETLVRELITELKSEDYVDINYEIVNESGASVYSASEEARKEFGNLSVEERSAINLGRRVIDPLSELVKVDPKSLGVGQYQHVVNQKDLSKALSFVVEKVVNRVGIDVNTASASILKYISGLNEKVALNIIEYREANGRFEKRSDLLKVKGLGPKAYEQSIGFMRIYDGVEKLDSTSIHPENYKEVKLLMKKHKISVSEIGSGDYLSLQDVSNKEEENLLREALKEYIDIREVNKTVIRETFNREISDLSVGMEIVGEVRSVVSFGAFIEIGLKNDGFIHISELGTGFIKNALDYLHVGEFKSFKIKDIDLDKLKVSLTLK